jgi:hypothetical protein
VTEPIIEFRETGSVTAIWVGGQRVIRADHTTGVGAAVINGIVDVIEALGLKPVRRAGEPSAATQTEALPADEHHYDTSCDDRPYCAIPQHHALEDMP